MEKLKELFARWNELGIPLPMVRDPLTGKGSVTLSMVVTAFFFNILSLGGKMAGAFGNLDTSAASYLLITSLTAYLGRKLIGDSKTGKTEMSAPETKEK